MSADASRRLLAATLAGTLVFATMGASGALALEGEVTESAPDVGGQGVPDVVFEAGSESVRVSDAEGLRLAIADPSVSHVVLTADIHGFEEDLLVDRDLVLDLNEYLLSFGRDSSLVVAGGDAVVRNGSLFGHSTMGEDRQGLSVPVVGQAGNLTLEDVFLDSEIEFLRGEGCGTIVLDDVRMRGGTEEHPLVVADDTCRIDMRKVEMSPLHGAACVVAADTATVEVREALIFSVEEPLGIAGHVPEGYVLRKAPTTDIYQVAGDLAGSLAEVSVTPSRLVYDGRPKRPQVTVAFAGSDVTQDVFVSYEDNLLPGTARVRVTPRLSCDHLIGEGVATFEIVEGQDTAPADPKADDPTRDASKTEGSDDGRQTTGTREVKAATLSELKAALADPTVKAIVLSADISSVGESLAANRALELNLNDHLLSFDDGGDLTVRGGSVVVRNGSVFSHSRIDDGAPCKVSSGTLTLAGGVNVHCYHVGCADVSGTGTLVVEDAKLTGGSERHAVVRATGASTVEVAWVELVPRDGAAFISTTNGAKATVKGAKVHASKTPAGLADHVPAGYVLEKSDWVDIYHVRGDLGGSLASASVSPSSYTYDGERKEPTVRVSFEGQDVTDECRITYRDNREVGTATVTIEPEIGSERLTGSRTETFAIKAASLAPASTSARSMTGASITVIPDSYTYDGTACEPYVTVAVAGHYLSSGDYDVSYSNNRNAGTASVTVTAKGSSGYTGSAQATFEIRRKEVTVYPDSHTKRAGEKDPTLTATVIGLVGSDKVSYTLSRESGETAGSYTISAKGNAEQGNYQVTYRTGTLHIFGEAASKEGTATPTTPISPTTPNSSTTLSTSRTPNSSTTPTSVTQMTQTSSPDTGAGAQARQATQSSGNRTVDAASPATQVAPAARTAANTPSTADATSSAAMPLMGSLSCVFGTAVLRLRRRKG